MEPGPGFHVISYLQQKISSIFNIFLQKNCVKIVGRSYHSNIFDIWRSNSNYIGYFALFVASCWIEFATNFLFRQRHAGTKWICEISLFLPESQLLGYFNRRSSPRRKTYGKSLSHVTILRILINKKIHL